MWILDKVLAALLPAESEETRQQARSRAAALAIPGGWLSKALRHHEQIDYEFRQIVEAPTARARMLAHHRLAQVLTAHGIAEEAVIYPALAEAVDEAEATTACIEQSATRLQMGLLARLAPMSDEYLDRLEHIRVAVAHHMYREESTWFLTLAGKLSAADQARLGEQYMGEFNRHVGGDSPQGARRVA